MWRAHGNTAHGHLLSTVYYLPHYHQNVNLYWGAVFGFFLGFGFGVGCALAVMYSIFLGGYRAALEDSELPNAPERLVKARARLQTGNSSEPS